MHKPHLAKPSSVKKKMSTHNSEGQICPHACHECIWGSRDIALLILIHSTRQRHPAALLPKMDSPVPKEREEIEKDLQVLGVRRWRELAIDRDKWRGIVRQAKAHSGL